MKRYLLAVLALGLMLISGSALAQSSSTTEPLWELHLDLSGAYSSPLGTWMMEKVLEAEPELEGNIDSFIEGIGFDPRTAVKQVVVYGNSFEPADVTIVANIGESTGNLEGWILAAPGYRSEELDAETLIHSFVVDQGDRSDRLWCVLPKAADGAHYMLVASFEEKRVLELARQIRKSTATPIPTKLKGDSILAFSIDDISTVPFDIDENDPGSAVVRTIKSVALNIACSSDEVRLALDLTASSPVKAKQLGQLLTGLKAMAQLAASSVGEEDEEAKLIMNAAQGVVVSHTEGETHVAASLKVAIDDLKKLSEF